MHIALLCICNFRLRDLGFKVYDQHTSWHHAKSRMTCSVEKTSHSIKNGLRYTDKRRWSMRQTWTIETIYGKLLMLDQFFVYANLH